MILRRYLIKGLCALNLVCHALPSAANPCGDLNEQHLKQELPQTFIEIAAEIPDMAFLDASWQSYLKLSDKNPAVAKFLPLQEVAAILSNREMVQDSRNFSEFVEHLEAAGDTATTEQIAESFRKTLSGKVPESSINDRVRDLLATPSESTLRRALGDMTFEETRDFFVGKDALAPSKDSLLGKYIAETGASTVRRRFKKNPGSDDLGEERLVVSVSEQAFPIFKKYFARHEFMSVIGHADIVQGGKYYPFSGGESEVKLPSSEFKVLPMVLLKPTEAQRLTQFMRLDRKYGFWAGNEGQQPWRLANYCATSAYRNCTQKIGNLPIGDTLVDEYIFPGPADASAENAVVTGDPETDKLPRRKKLEPYQHKDPLMTRVWKVPGQEQFAAVLGQMDANLRGEFANPGWVISTLLGPTTNARVPIVFVVRQNHKEEIPENFNPVYENPM